MRRGGPSEPKAADTEHIAGIYPGVPLAVADWLDLMIQFADYPGLPQLKHADYDIAAAYLGEMA